METCISLAEWLLEIFSRVYIYFDFVIPRHYIINMSACNYLFYRNLKYLKLVLIDKRAETKVFFIYLVLLENGVVIIPLIETKEDALRDLGLFLQFKKREKHSWKMIAFSKVEGFNLQVY